MPRKALDDYAKEVLTRCAHPPPPENEKRFKVYSGTLSDRLRQVEFILQDINQLYPQADTVSTEAFQPFERLHLQCTVFWALAYSMFDIVTHAANAIHNVIPDEKDVAFSRARTWPAGLPFRGEAIRIINTRRYYRRLYNLRNTALHRRSVLVERHAIRTPKAYAGFATTGARTERVEWYVCERPEDIKPSRDSGRELLDDCKAILSSTREDIIRLLRAI